MVIVRPIASDDLDQLEELARMTTFGLTTLPKDRKLLKGRIEESLHGFEKMKTSPSRPRGETYLFVMEDLDTGKVVGTTGIVSKVGGFDPHWTYRIEENEHKSEMLKVSKTIKTLHLSMEHNGPCEIGSLFLTPEARGGGRGRVLSVSRFLFMAEHPEFFDPMVIAEMRGVIDDKGRSPFWEALGRHFFEIELPDADYLVMVNKRFIADLMPRHPIYIPLLPPDAQNVIAQVHEFTGPALKILEAEGFKNTNEVDIFEAGPVVSCPLTEIRAVKESFKASVEQISDEPIDAPLFAIATTGADGRTAMGQLQNLVQDDPGRGVRLMRITALALGVKVGQEVRACQLRPGNSQSE